MTIATAVHIHVYMGKRLTDRFLAELDVALATLTDVAEGTGRHYRSMQSYRRRERRVTVEAARDLVKYLRRRAKRLDRAADSLEAAADKEDASG